MRKVMADVNIVLESHSQAGQRDLARDEAKVQQLLDVVGQLKTEAEEVGKQSCE